MDNKSSPRGELAASIAAAPDASFDMSRRDSNIIRSIVARAFRDAVLRPQIHFVEDPDDARLTLTMDIEAVHANGNPLDLEKLLDSDDFTFRHDISGIQGNVDRRSGRLRNFFTPRTSKRDAERQAAIVRQAPSDTGEGLKSAPAAAKEGKDASTKGAGGERAIPRKVDIAPVVREAQAMFRRKPAAKKSAAKKSPTRKVVAKKATARKSAPPATRRRPR